ARYTNLRDIRSVHFHGVGFMDIEWQRYDFEKHLEAASAYRPAMTVARDITSETQIDSVLREAEQLSKYATHIVIVPKDLSMSERLNMVIPRNFLLGYSVPTKYGHTDLPIDAFVGRPVHLLGGRPEVQRKIADQLDVVSIDCNRFTYDARFGDYFDGEIFRSHPTGGYKECLCDSISNINKLWEGYEARW
ncbi:hypothetical protein KA005_51225, partial [bacterium]|nr:hypothetical protein [bacterium]